MAEAPGTNPRQPADFTPELRRLERYLSNLFAQVIGRRNWTVLNTCVKLIRLLLLNPDVTFGTKSELALAVELLFCRIYREGVCSLRVQETALASFIHLATKILGSRLPPNMQSVFTPEYVFKYHEQIPLFRSLGLSYVSGPLGVGSIEDQPSSFNLNRKFPSENMLQKVERTVHNFMAGIENPNPTFAWLVQPEDLPYTPMVPMRNEDRVKHQDVLIRVTQMYEQLSGANQNAPPAGPSRVRIVDVSDPVATEALPPNQWSNQRPRPIETQLSRKRPLAPATNARTTTPPEPQIPNRLSTSEVDAKRRLTKIERELAALALVKTYCGCPHFRPPAGLTFWRLSRSVDAVCRILDEFTTVAHDLGNIPTMMKIRQFVYIFGEEFENDLELISNQLTQFSHAATELGNTLTPSTAERPLQQQITAKLISHPLMKLFPQIARKFADFVSVQCETITNFCNTNKHGFSSSRLSPPDFPSVFKNYFDVFHDLVDGLCDQITKVVMMQKPTDMSDSDFSSLKMKTLNSGFEEVFGSINVA